MQSSVSTIGTTYQTTVVTPYILPRPIHVACCLSVRKISQHGTGLESMVTNPDYPSASCFLLLITTTDSNTHFRCCPFPSPKYFPLEATPPFASDTVYTQHAILEGLWP